MSDLSDQTVQKRKKHKSRQKQQTPVEKIGSSLVGMTVISLIFGDSTVALTLFAVVIVFFLFASLNSGFRHRLQTFLQSRDGSSLLGTSLTLLVLTGIFGTHFLMSLELVLAGVVLFFLTMGTRTDLPSASPWEMATLTTAQPQPAPAALPAETAGEKISPLNVRSLCRGLPPMQAGQVMNAVEELELVMVEAERRGNAKAAFDARQALTDYLPGTVEAWKAQRPEDQNISELDRALEEVRAIAGSSDGRAQRRAWETQQRFLRSRTGASPEVLLSEKKG